MTDFFTSDNGILGIEALLTWNGFLWTDREEETGYVHLVEVVGPHDGPDHEDPRAPKVGRIGETPFPTMPLGVTYVFKGEARAQSLPGLRAFGTALRAAFADVRTEGEMTVVAHEDLGGPAGVFHAKRMPGGLQMPDRQATTRWSRPFTLGLRLSDPRVYFPSLAVDETGSDDVEVTNEGSAPADPVITLEDVTGVGDDLRVAVTNAALTAGELTAGALRLMFRQVPEGTMVIDFSARTAMVDGEHVELVVAESDWWDSFVYGIEPGATVTIAQLGADSIQVEFTPAAW